MEDQNEPLSTPRCKSDGLRGWTEESSPAFSPLQRLRQGPTFQPPRRSFPLRSRPFKDQEDLKHSQPLEQEIEGLQALASERHCREHFAVRRRLHQLQNAQAKEAAGGVASLEKEEAADELEKVKAALEELRRGGEEEKLHRNQLEERVMREIKDLKSPMTTVRSLSQLERKRCQPQGELQEALRRCTEELEAQRVEQRALEEQLEQLRAIPKREEALRSELCEAEATLRSEAQELRRLRHDVQEQDDALASIWGLQSSYQREAAEASRYREATEQLEAELQAQRDVGRVAQEACFAQLPQHLQEELAQCEPGAALTKLCDLVAALLKDAQLQRRSPADEAGGHETEAPRAEERPADALEKRREVNLCDGGRGAYPPSPSVSPPPHKRWKDDAPQSAADLFARAEALCDSQHFAEAAELFRCVLAALRSSAERDAMRSVEAEVWAHLGVAMQSLDDIAAAIESYCQAVRLDPSLHVCFANLATLYLYLEDFSKAEEQISKALALEPTHKAYLDIKDSIGKRSKRRESA